MDESLIKLIIPQQKKSPRKCGKMEQINNGEEKHVIVRSHSKCKSQSTQQFGKCLAILRCQKRLNQPFDSTMVGQQRTVKLQRSFLNFKPIILSGLYCAMFMLLVANSLLLSSVSAYIQTEMLTNQSPIEHPDQTSRMSHASNQADMMNSPTSIHSIPFYAPSEPIIVLSDPENQTVSGRTEPSPVSLKKSASGSIVVEYKPVATRGLQNSRGPQASIRREEKEMIKNMTVDENSSLAKSNRFSFTVNGKQLSLEPPVELASKSANKSTQSNINNNKFDLQVAESSINTIERSQESRTIWSSGDNDNNSNSNNNVSGEETKKVNRVGDQQDYDFGFEVNASSESEMSNDIAANSGTGSSSSSSSNNRPAKPTTKSTSTNGRGNSQQVMSMQHPSSSSSSLMLPMTHAALRYNSQSEQENLTDNPSLLSSSSSSSSLDNEESPAITSSSNIERNNTSRPNQSRSQRLQYKLQQVNGGSADSRIISNWPKSATAPMATSKLQGYLNTDRHLAPTVVALNQQHQSKMATSSASVASTRSVNNPVRQQQQQQQQQHYSTLLPIPIDSNSTSKLITVNQNDADYNQADESGVKGAQISGTKSNYHPRAPVYAKSRYTPAIMSQLSSYSSPAKLTTKPDLVEKMVKKSTWKQSSSDHNDNNNLQSTQLKPNEWENDNESILMATTTPATGSNSFRPLQPATATTLPTNYSTKSIDHSMHILNEPNVRLPEQDSSIYSSNNYLAKSAKKSLRQHEGNTSTTTTPRKSHLSQRDLSFKIYPTPLSYNPASGSASNLARSLRSGSMSPDTGSIGKSHESARLSDNSSSTTAMGLVGHHFKSTMDRGMLQTYDNMKQSSIVRTGTILPHPTSSMSPNLRSLVPAAMALLAQAQSDPQSRSGQQLRALLATQSAAPNGQQVMINQPNESFPPIVGSRSAAISLPINQVASNQQSMEQMFATGNHLGVSHLTPQNSGNLGTSESNSYNSIVANMQDYPDRSSGSSSHSGPEGNLIDSGSNSPQSQSGSNDDRDRDRNRDLSGGSTGNGNNNNNNGNSMTHDYQVSGSDTYESNLSSLRNQLHPSSGINSNQNQKDQQNSRISNSDIYLKAEHKTGDSSSLIGGQQNLRSSVDPFEEMTGSLTTSEYERDLADLDEEFNRHTGFRTRPGAGSGSGSLMSDSYLTLSPERYESQSRYHSRRPPPSSYDYPEYLSTANSMSSMIPRPYSQRIPSSWSSATYGAADGADLWQDPSGGISDYSPLASFISPSHHYSYRVRPRYHTVRQYPAFASSAPHYLATSASEQQQLTPASYNFVPASYSQAPTESISFTLSPLAAAAAAAATALAAADKSRHQSHAWLTLPRLASTLAAAGSPQSVSSAGSGSLATSSSAAPTASYLQPAVRSPSPYSAVYGASAMPTLYAIAPRPPTPLATAASGATPSFIPYFHAAGGPPTIIAYRPASTVLNPSAPLLTAASFAYPLRLPLVATPMVGSTAATTTTVARPHQITFGPTPSRSAFTGSGARPIYLQDLQFAETKPKSNLNGSGSGSSSGSNGDSKGLSKVGGSFTAMARNLTKKMFGSASQIRPQHVAPPSNFNDILASVAQNSSSGASIQH